MSPEREVRILIVDDQRDVARVLRTSLELLNRGYFILDVPSGEEALLELRRGGFELLVTDYRLPGMSGIELIQRARKLVPAIKAIVISAHKPDEIKEKLADVEVAGILEKPIDTEAFTKIVNKSVFGTEEPEVTAPPPSPEPEVEEKIDEDAIARELSALHIDLGAKGVAFVNKRGKVLLRAGSLDDMERFADLAGVLARSFASTAEISSYLGDQPSFDIHYYSGNRHDIYALSVGARFFLAILFPSGSQKQMGPVLRFGRPHVQAMLRALGEITAAPAEKPPAAEPAPKPVESPEAVRPSPVKEPAKGKEKEKEKASPPPPQEKEAAPQPLPDLDLENLDLDLSDLGDLDSFWEQAAGETTKVSEDALSLEEAIKLGLVTKDLGQSSSHSPE
jgi:CheY-like chemotaxis protein